MDLYKMSLRPTSPTRPITPDFPRGKHSMKFGVWQKLQHFFGRDGTLQCLESDGDANWPKSGQPDLRQKCANPTTTRPVGVGLPRQATFKRQNSEKRDRLLPVEPLPQERRAFSTSRPRPTALARFRSSSVPPPERPTKTPAYPILSTSDESGDPRRDGVNGASAADQNPSDPEQAMDGDDQLRPSRPASRGSSTGSRDVSRDFLDDRNQLDRELDTKWILNLSMHFRDKSDREKFFVTYAETPTKWRRVTVSCDYRGAEPGSLETDLKELQLQRDKSMQIYEAIRDSLVDIKFYDTVTNLKLETRDGRLHVHVTEDANEIVAYPPITSLQHILFDDGFAPKQIRESELSFDAHLSGFVYKVTYQGKSYIKKEIPGPDTVDEFLYEVNALHALHRSEHVIDLEAIITDDQGQSIKGLLIDYAQQGAVVDLLYDYKGVFPWEQRERWARQAVQGLSDIHEEGYVQGDFTLSNIVIDGKNNARIIDINRRGCPVGWEPPEIAKKIASNQRISMYIGQKSDLYQLGMSLWALAMDDDEPERHDPPLNTHDLPSEVPLWYQEIVQNCLSTEPRNRLSATELVKLFPPDEIRPWSSHQGYMAARPIRSDKQYIDPASAVERDDLEKLGYGHNHLDEVMYSSRSSRDDPALTWPQSSSYDREVDSASSEMERPRGRRHSSDRDFEVPAQPCQQAIPTVGADAAPEICGLFPAISISADRPESLERQRYHGRDADLDMPFCSGGLLADETHVTPEPVGLVPFISMSSEEDTARNVSADPSRQGGEGTTNSTDHTVDLSESLGDMPSPPSTAVQHVSDQPSFHGRSETSEDTRHDLSIHGLDGQHVLEHGAMLGLIHHAPSELAGFGGHLNVSGPSPEQGRGYGGSDDIDRAFSPLPTLPFSDSGYSESGLFGLGLDDHSAEAEAETKSSRDDEREHVCSDSWRDIQVPNETDHTSDLQLDETSVGMTGCADHVDKPMTETGTPVSVTAEDSMELDPPSILSEDAAKQHPDGGTGTTHFAGPSSSRG